MRWSDIDLDEHTIRIERSVSATRSSGLVIKPTKTGRVRRVSITTQATDALIQHRIRAEQVAADDHRFVDPADLVFTNDSTCRRPWRPELVTRRWERLRAASGMPGVRIHDIRHFVATELFTAGIDVRTVANRLGHARTSTTMDIYWGFVPARDRDAADHLQRVLE